MGFNVKSLRLTLLKNQLEDQEQFISIFITPAGYAPFAKIFQTYIEEIQKSGAIVRKIEMITDGETSINDELLVSVVGEQQVLGNAFIQAITPLLQQGMVGIRETKHQPVTIDAKKK